MTATPTAVRQHPALWPRIRRWLAPRAAALRDGNPVLVKEMRTRMRGVRACWIVSIYLTLLALVVLFVYYTQWQAWVTASQSGARTFMRSGSDVGRAIFQALFSTQGGLIALIAPALTSGMITVEREQRAYELLSSSPLTAGQVVRGKLLAAFLFVVLLLTASLPLVSISMLFGGVTPGQIICCYLVIASTAFLYASAGIFWSAAFQRTSTATAGAYVTTVLLFLAALFPGMRAVSKEVGEYGLDGTDTPFQSVNGAMAPFRSLVPEPFLNGSIPSWLPALLLNVLLGLLFCVMASERLDGFRSAGPAWRRLLATAVWIVGWFFPVAALAGYHWSAVRSGTPAKTMYERVEPFREDLIPFFIAIAAGIVLVGPILVTRGAAETDRRTHRPWFHAFNPAAWLSDTLPGGAGLLMFWAALPLLWIAIAFPLVGAGPLLRRSQVLLPGSLVLLGLALAMCGIGVLWSTLSPRGWDSRIRMYVSLLFLICVPYLALAGSEPADTQLYVQPAELPRSPLVPVDTLRSIEFEKRLRPLLIPDYVSSGRPPVWVQGFMLYTFIGAGCLGGAGLISAVRRRRREPSQEAAALPAGPAG